MIFIYFLVIQNIINVLKYYWGKLEMERGDQEGRISIFANTANLTSTQEQEGHGSNKMGFGKIILQSQGYLVTADGHIRYFKHSQEDIS